MDAPKSAQASSAANSDDLAYYSGDPRHDAQVDEQLDARDAANRQELSDEEVLAMWRRGELVVKTRDQDELIHRTGRILHGNLCVCPEKGDGEWCDKCEGYALEQGQ